MSSHPTPRPPDTDGSTLAASADTEDLYRRLALWLVGVARAPHHPVQHDGPCGTRLACVRCGAAYAPYRSVELLGDGQLLFHCHGERANLVTLTAIRWIGP